MTFLRLDWDPTILDTYHPKKMINDRIIALDITGRILDRNMIAGVHQLAAYGVDHARHSNNPHLPFSSRLDTAGYALR